MRDRTRGVDEDADREKTKQKHRQRAKLPHTSTPPTIVGAPHRSVTDSMETVKIAAPAWWKPPRYREPSTQQAERLAEASLNSNDEILVIINRSILHGLQCN